MCPCDYCVSPSPKNWVFGFFRLALTLESGFGACWDRGLGTWTRAWQSFSALSIQILLLDESPEFNLFCSSIDHWHWDWEGEKLKAWISSKWICFWWLLWIKLWKKSKIPKLSWISKSWKNSWLWKQFTFLIQIEDFGFWDFLTLKF